MPARHHPARPGELAAPTIRSHRFRTEREASWRELESLLDKAEPRGVRHLDTEKLLRLPVLYRAAVSSLSVARSISLDKNLVVYLESLAARAYCFVYGAHHSALAAIRDFINIGYPRLVRDLRWWVLVSILLLAAGASAGYLMTSANPERFWSFVSDDLAAGRSPLSTRQELLEILHHRGTGRVDVLGAFASFLFTHNARIGLSCFVAGFAAGIPVALVVLTNGMALGAFAAIHVRQGIGLEMWAWVLPHGITELLAVCLCAAAGLRVGVAILFPGRLRRLDSLALHGRRSAAVVVGTLGLFLIAAVIEGFFRQMVIDSTSRLLVAAMTLIVWTLYFVTAGRQEEGTIREGTR